MGGGEGGRRAGGRPRGVGGDQAEVVGGARVQRPAIAARAGRGSVPCAGQARGVFGAPAKLGGAVDVLEVVGRREAFGVDACPSAAPRRPGCWSPRPGRARRGGLALPRRARAQRGRPGLRSRQQRASSPAPPLAPCCLRLASCCTHLPLRLDLALRPAACVLRVAHRRVAGPESKRGQGRVDRLGRAGSGRRRPRRGSAGGFGEAAADAGVVEVDRAGVGADQGAVGEEEGIGAVGGGVDEAWRRRRRARWRSAPTQPAGAGAAAFALGLPLVDVGVAVGVGRAPGRRSESKKTRRAVG